MSINYTDALPIYRTSAPASLQVAPNTTTATHPPYSYT